MPQISPSQERVLDELTRGPLRAQDVARRIGVDTSAVRRHLDNLQSLALVEAYDVIKGPGRPKKFFQLTSAGRERGPRNYGLLLAALMRKVAEGQGRKQLFRYLESIAADLAGSTSKAKDAKKRLDLLLAKYNELGFDAELAKDGRQTVLVQRNCPFLSVATGDPDAMCRRLDEGMTRAALPGAKVRLQASMAMGDQQCEHVIQWPAKPPRKRPGPKDKKS